MSARTNVWRGHRKQQSDSSPLRRRLCLQRGNLMHINSPFTDVQTAIKEIPAGRMVVVVDDEDRENEGDLTMAAEMITPEAINFMARYGRGLICLGYDT